MFYSACLKPTTTLFIIFYLLNIFFTAPVLHHLSFAINRLEAPLSADVDDWICGLFLPFLSIPCSIYAYRIYCLGRLFVNKINSTFMYNRSSTSSISACRWLFFALASNCQIILMNGRGGGELMQALPAEMVSVFCLSLVPLLYFVPAGLLLVFCAFFYILHASPT